MNGFPPTASVFPPGDFVKSANTLPPVDFHVENSLSEFELENVFSLGNLTQWTLMTREENDLRFWAKSYRCETRGERSTILGQVLPVRKLIVPSDIGSQRKPGEVRSTSGLWVPGVKFVECRRKSKCYLWSCVNCLLILVACFICCICKSSFISMDITKNVQCMMNVHDGFNLLKHLAEACKHQSFCLIIIHIWSKLLIFRENRVWRIQILIIRLTHANVWESMGKPCSCT